MLQTYPSIPDDATHGVCVDWIVAWNRHDARSIRHDNVRALAENTEACLFQGGYGSKMIDPR